MCLGLGQDAVDESVCGHVRRYGMHDAVGDVLRNAVTNLREFIDALLGKN